MAQNKKRMQFLKRQRELQKKKKKEEKRLRRQQRREESDNDDRGAAESESGESEPEGLDPAGESTDRSEEDIGKTDVDESGERAKDATE